MRNEKAYDHKEWEARVERRRFFDSLDMLGGQCNVQCRNVLLELFNFSATDNREYVGKLLEMVRNSNYLSHFCKCQPEFLSVTR